MFPYGIAGPYGSEEEGVSGSDAEAAGVAAKELPEFVPPDAELVDKILKQVWSEMNRTNKLQRDPWERIVLCAGSTSVFERFKHPETEQCKEALALHLRSQLVSNNGPKISFCLLSQCGSKKGRFRCVLIGSPET